MGGAGRTGRPRSDRGSCPATGQGLACDNGGGHVQVRARGRLGHGREGACGQPARPGPGAGGPQFLVPLRAVRGGSTVSVSELPDIAPALRCSSVGYSSSTMAWASEASRAVPSTTAAGRGPRGPNPCPAGHAAATWSDRSRPLGPQHRAVGVARARFPRRGIDGLARSRRTLGERRALDVCGGRSRRRPGRLQVQLTTVRGSVNPMMKDIVVRLPALASTACTKAPLKA